MAKLKYVDHSHENPVQAFFDFFNICFYQPGYVGFGGVSIDPDNHSICDEVYARFAQGAEMYSFSLIHLVLSFSEEEASNISEEELLNLSDSLSHCCVRHIFFYVAYKTDTGAEIHILLSPLGYPMPSFINLDKLYITIWHCIQYHFDRPELWEGHTELRMEKDDAFQKCFCRVDNNFMKPILEIMDF